MMKMSSGVVLMGLLWAVPAAADHWHENDKHWKKHWAEHDREDREIDHQAARCYFQPHDVEIIREYYAPRYRRLPPGLAKKYERTGRLPPGWQKKVEPLPIEVERRLVVLPPGYRRGYVDGSIVVYLPGTEVVVDVVPLWRP